MKVLYTINARGELLFTSLSNLGKFGKYNVCVTGLDKTSEAKLEEAKKKPRETNKGDRFYSFALSEKNVEFLTFVDRNKLPLPKSTAIPNGTKANLYIVVGEGRFGVTAFLRGIQIIEFGKDDRKNPFDVIQEAFDRAETGDAEVANPEQGEDTPDDSIPF